MDAPKVTRIDLSAEGAGRGAAGRRRPARRGARAATGRLGFPLTRPARHPPGQSPPGLGEPERSDEEALRERVLVVAPIGRDAALAREVLEGAGLTTHICEDLHRLCDELELGGGAALVTEEAFFGPAVDRLVRFLDQEPAWSAFPLVFLTAERGDPGLQAATLEVLAPLRNVTFLERPLPILTLMSAMRVAVEGRWRQYEVRDLLSRLEEGVRQRDQFLAMLGHELRNPLGAIHNALEILKHPARDADVVERAVGILDRQIPHLERLVDDLLDVSRVTRGAIELRRERVDVRQLVESAVQMARPLIEARNHRLTVDMPSTPVPLEADPTRIEQVFANLLTNAAKYTEPGGDVAVVVERGVTEVEVRVRDTGIGMRPDFLELVFEVFSQAAPAGEGLGLGLTLARRLVEMHGGSIRAHSEGLGRGSEFVVRLPRLTG